MHGNYPQENDYLWGEKEGCCGTSAKSVICSLKTEKYEHDEFLSNNLKRGTSETRF